MLSLLFIFAAVAHAQLQPVELQTPESRTSQRFQDYDEFQQLQPIRTSLVSVDAQDEACDDFCYYLTTGECQHPNLGDYNCFAMNNNGTCPTGTVECGMRPTLPLPGVDGPGSNPIVAPEGLLQTGTIIASNISLPANFKLVVRIIPDHVQPQFSDIIEFDTGIFPVTGGLDVRNAAPAIVFRPNTFDFYVRYLSGTLNRHLSVYPRGDASIIVGEESVIELRFLQEGIQVFVNGVICEERSMDGYTRPAYDNVVVRASSGRYYNNLAAGVTLLSPVIEELNGDEEYPLLY